MDIAIINLEDATNEVTTTIEIRNHLSTSTRQSRNIQRREENVQLRKFRRELRIYQS